MVSIHEDAITPGCHQALDALRETDFISDFYLAGGTALALQIGHRISTDLDWFSKSNALKDAERETIIQTLKSKAQFEIVSEQDGALFTRLFGTDVGLMHQPHPLVEALVEYNGVYLASPIDIGLMKLAAVNSRGARRDFVDLYCLREIVSLDRLLELAGEKYADRPSFLAVAARALTYFQDAEQQPMPRMKVPASWEEVRAYCEGAAERLTRRLSGLDRHN